jgi:antitoxin (DNA-binding transcriptional repressor) of toxin-antitoxin stability system
MKTVTIHDAKSNLSKYIAAAKKGEKIYIGSFGKAEVVLTAIKQAPVSKRRFGFAKGKFGPNPDAAFTPEVEAEITALMYGDTTDDHSA